ncbi:CoA transferase subunit A [Halobacillus mangrovi]|uniref:Acyl CoA:acetate/3-ketoacid CoA transferase subunit alpha n=1 Tax=Halobacillus mangrovi TaxID=402384 RepID=A0A1W5ZRA9_9BACI|nr:CoA transferase subunit A [Halobacillus mangrovi]ARI75840.1 acyl CoA:acetate/3-ketoacid CoA transferase subunit alpha [Halobacillus mangrovi]
MVQQRKMPINKVATVEQAISHINDGCSLMYGGFGGIGNPPTIIDAILKKGVKDLTLIGNDAGFPHIGIGKVIREERAKKLIASHIGSNPVAGQLMTEGKLEVEFSPQGTLAERIRAGGVGLEGILIDVGVDSMVEEGKKKIIVGNKECLLETPLKADVSIVYAKKADTFGNLIYDTSARNTAPLVAMAGNYTIAEAEEVVPAGELDPECIVTPGVFVDMVIHTEGVNWKWAWE